MQRHRGGIPDLLQGIPQQDLGRLFLVLLGKGDNLGMAEPKTANEGCPSLLQINPMGSNCEQPMTGESVRAHEDGYITSNAIPCFVQNATISVRVMKGCRSICDGFT